MTDLETMLLMLTNASITYELGSYNGESTVKVFGGYPGFFSVLTFDPVSGKLKSLEAFE